MRKGSSKSVRLLVAGREVEAAVIESPGHKFKLQLSQLVLNRAMKGVHRGNPKGTPTEIEKFCERFRPLAGWVVERMPKNLSAAVGAVTLKAVLFYGEEIAEKFCTTMAKGTFNGADDPAHLLWVSLNKNRGKEKATENYQRAVCAIRAYCEGRKIASISPAKSDIFEWDTGLKLPKELEATAVKLLGCLRPAAG